MMTLRNFPCPVAILDADLRYVDASAAWEERHLGGAPVKRGQAFVSTFPAAPSKWLDAFRRCLDGAVERRDRNLAPAADGSPRYYRWEARPFGEAPAGKREIIVFLEEISEQVLTPASPELSDMMNALRLSQERLSLALDASGIGAWEWDIASDTVTWADECWRLFGFTPVNRTLRYEQFLELVHPDDRSAVENAVSESLQTGHEYSIDFRIYWPDRSIHWIAARGRVLRDAPGSPPRRLIGTVMNIDDRKLLLSGLTSELEEKSALWSSILESANYAIIATDPDGLVITFNPAAERLLGYSAKEVVGLKSPAMWHAPEEIESRAQALSRELKREIRAGFQAFVAKAQTLGVPDENEWTFIRKDGRRVPVLLSVTALHGHEGRNIGYLGVISDLTERKRAQARLHETLNSLERKVSERTEELTRAIRYRDEFMSIASHELNTPLTPLMLQVEILKRRLEAIPAEASLLSSLRSIENQVSRLARLVENLLDVSRIATGRFELRLEEVELSEVARMTARQFEPQVLKAGGRISVDSAGPTPARLDRTRIEQVLVNLISNANKYAPGSRIRIRVSCDGDEIQLEVTDEGPGIPLSDQERIFERFERASTTDWSRSGLGLGLYISRQIIQAHGGSIQLQSSPGKGSTFTIRLPRSGKAIQPRDVKAG